MTKFHIDWHFKVIEVGHYVADIDADTKKEALRYAYNDILWDTTPHICEYYEEIEPSDAVITKIN